MQLTTSQFRDRAIECSSAIDLDRLERCVDRAKDALLALGQEDGHWRFELEADCCITAEYILMRHFRGELIDHELERKFTVYLKRTQGAHGAWPLFFGGPPNISSSVKAYFALKMIGEPMDAPHMVRAREAILAQGGAAQSNVFTRSLLALYGEAPWRAVPFMPVEIMLLPDWFPFHLNKISYWGRALLVPLLVLMTKKPRAKNPRGVTIRELFVTPPEAVKSWPKGEHQTWPWVDVFTTLDSVLRIAEPFLPKRTREKSISRAVAWVERRLNGLHGLGAILPPMIASVLMYDTLGLSPDDPRVAAARESIERLLVIHDDEAYCQPCVSPVWDTALATHVLMEVGGGETEARAKKAVDWLAPLQVLDVKGDWAARRPLVRPGGWAFQYANPYYPDVDDTAVVVTAMHRLTQRFSGCDYEKCIARGREWIEGMQSENGGWGAFDADNDHHYLNNIPFADHGALLDPPEVDVSSRCLWMLAQLGDTPQTSEVLRRGLDYVLNEQMTDGSWFGRWGANYLYGTWSALCALDAVHFPHTHAAVRRAVKWLVETQNPDGGWGEDLEDYRLDYRGYAPASSTASQTAWALLGLMAAGGYEHEAVARGVAYVLSTQNAAGLWNEAHFTGTGFPRVFYLRYHGYGKIFPLWAIARYRNLCRKEGQAHILRGDPRGMKESPTQAGAFATQERSRVAKVYARGH